MTDLIKAVAPILGIVIVAVCAVGLALAWLGVLPGFAREEPTPDGEPMTPASTAEVLPMDANAPANTKTATFALG
jgi:hypothetical protein